MSYENQNCYLSNFDTGLTILQHAHVLVFYACFNFMFIYFFHFVFKCIYAFYSYLLI